eukprot:CAMPEP_0197831114 /NCGR_PEP_ID=MMETSP1437-20131217/7711_1 /TAXON_ID=49252 ORGANISM="Eucampia antarctica, Strain CCMP1452" /NCGR_SAMPLE_ID=MMETSP1437 /ASSEMBLY_ACC=CAM_ASM_001096 /LENGTH=99 /DNA_ID=CAMNT_0043433889 /DNA_START=68 /DNA_END=367 /DNA_ORIENTATION=-
MNPGFGTQLELYRRMVLIGVASKRKSKETNNGVVPMVLHQSRPHATFRTGRAKSDFTTSGQIPAKFCPVDYSSNKRHVCNRCNEILLTDHNIVLELSSR